MIRLCTLALALNCGFAATACASAPKPKPPTACEKETRKNSNGPLWWEVEPNPAAACPPGTKARQVKSKKPAPPGRALFCELPNGLRHGRFVMRGGKDEVLDFGFLVHGQRHGPWIRFDGISGGWVKETFNCGRVTGRQPTTKPKL